MKFSIIIPAYNEEKYVGATLENILTELSVVNHAHEIIVVDNDSTDKTAEIATQFGARVISETVHNISTVRNRGAHAASGNIFIFVDADTQVPSGLLKKIAASMEDKKCFGGAVSVEYTEITRGCWVKYYLLGWKFWEKFVNTKQGATQFCRKTAFDEINGFDQNIFVGEDVEFYWRLAKLAKARGGYLNFITDPRVKTSARRFNEMNLWGLLLRTNPIFVRLNWRRKAAWNDWYDKTIR